MLDARHRTTAITYAVIGVVLLIVVVLLPSTGAFAIPEIDMGTGETHEATVVEVLERARVETPGGVMLNERLLVDIGGEQVEVNRSYVEGGVDGFEVNAGDGVIVAEIEGPEGMEYTLQDRSRRVQIWALALVFAAMVVLVGRRQGVLSLVGLALSFLVIVRFVVPGILAGGNPLLLAIIGGVVIMASTLLLSHGVNMKTWIALAGTTASLVITGILAWASVHLVQLTGVADEYEATVQAFTNGTIDPRGLLLGGIIIGALGVLDDVTTTQSATVVELRRANPALGTAQLLRRAMNVGRDHIAATTNTLLLAYTGASLPLLLILAMQDHSIGVLISLDALSTEIVRTLVGSIGIVAAVPITTLLAAFLVGSGMVDVSEEPVTTHPGHGHAGHEHADITALASGEDPEDRR